MALRRRGTTMKREKRDKKMDVGEQMSREVNQASNVGGEHARQSVRLGLPETLRLGSKKPAELGNWGGIAA